jgi:hypothetical protein
LAAMNGAAPEIDDADGSQSGGGSTETEWTDTDPDDGGTAGEELTGVLDTAAAGSATAEWWARAQGGDDDTGGALESIAAAPLRRRQRRKRRALPSQKCRWRCTRARWVVSTSAALAVATLLHMRGPLRDDVAGRDQQQQHSVSQGLDSSMAQFLRQPSDYDHRARQSIGFAAEFEPSNNRYSPLDGHVPAAAWHSAAGGSEVPLPSFAEQRPLPAADFGRCDSFSVPNGRVYGTLVPSQSDRLGRALAGHVFVRCNAGWELRRGFSPDRRCARATDGRHAWEPGDSAWIADSVCGRSFPATLTRTLTFEQHRHLQCLEQLVRRHPDAGAPPNEKRVFETSNGVAQEGYGVGPGAMPGQSNRPGVLMKLFAAVAPQTAAALFHRWHNNSQQQQQDSAGSSDGTDFRDHALRCLGCAPPVPGSVGVYECNDPQRRRFELADVQCSRPEQLGGSTYFTYLGYT